MTYIYIRCVFLFFKVYIIVYCLFLFLLLYLRTVSGLYFLLVLLLPQFNFPHGINEVPIYLPTYRQKLIQKKDVVSRCWRQSSNAVLV